eukprot:1372136-Amorphochlora_amoeboformis.AAC.2
MDIGVGLMSAEHIGRMSDLPHIAYLHALPGIFQALLAMIQFILVRFTSVRIPVRWYVTSQVCTGVMGTISLRYYMDRKRTRNLFTDIDISRISVVNTTFASRTEIEYYYNGIPLSSFWTSKQEELLDQTQVNSNTHLSLFLLLRVRDLCLLFYVPFAPRDARTLELVTLGYIHILASPLSSFFFPGDGGTTLWYFIIPRIIFGLLMAMFAVYINNLLRDKWQSIFIDQETYRKEIELKEEQAVKASQRARAMIMHGMKNIYASMSATCEVTVDRDDLTVDDLKEELRNLQGLAIMGVILCNKRAKMAMVEDENFSPESKPVRCRKLLNAVKHLSPRIKIASDNDDIYVMGDEDVIYFILENALTNAVRHGIENSTIGISL